MTLCKHRVGRVAKRDFYFFATLAFSLRDFIMTSLRLCEAKLCDVDVQNYISRHLTAVVICTLFTVTRFCMSCFMTMLNDQRQDLQIQR